MRAMNLSHRSVVLVLTIIILVAVALVLGGCEGKRGRTGAPGPEGPAGEPGPPGPSLPIAIGPASALSIKGTSATVQSNPVFTFSVTTENGNPYTGLLPNDLRFAIAKLMPAAGPGMPTQWQSYILRRRTAVAGSPGDGGEKVQATRETPNANALPGDPGSLVNHGDGTYTYTFSTDIETVTCPLVSEPCVDAFGQALDFTYDATLPHRVAVQTQGPAPLTAAAYDFIPATNTPLPPQRDIVNYDNCNECHNKLVMHGTRTETRYCVACHNLGSTDPSSYDPAKETGGAGQHAAVLSSGTVDFKVLIHKLHRGASLPSVVLGPDFVANSGDEPGEYGIYGYQGTIISFANIHFPQDIRNCTKCHTNSDPDPDRNTAQGNNWNDVPSIPACGACHDNIKFDVAGPPVGADPDGHPGGPVNFNTNCTACHSTGLIGKSPAEAHVIPGRAEAKNYELVINDVRGDGMTGPPFLEVDISAINPNTGVAYDLTADPAFTGSAADLRIQVAWSLFDSGASVDYNNVPQPLPTPPYTPSEAPTPAQPLRLDFIDSGALVICDGMTLIPDDAGTLDWICTAGGSGIYTFAKQSALPAGAKGTGRVDFEGHPANPSSPGSRMSVRSAFKDFAITDMTPIARRQVVDINKCNKCHYQLSLHGGNRTDEPQVCVMCHNPSLTDISYQASFNSGPCDGQPARPKQLDLNGDVLYPLESCLDGQTEQNAQFKVLVHGLHAGAFRTGPPFQVRRNNFKEEVHFPGILSDCETCHEEGTYELAGALEAPTLNGLQSASIATTPGVNDMNIDPLAYATTLNDQADDLRISPTAAACSACHDSATVQAHMTDLGGAVFGDTQANINLTYETCSVCHGPGAIADVEAVHDAATAEEKGLVLP